MAISIENVFVVYCRSGRRSKVAALLLHQRKLDAVSLEGGIMRWPLEKFYL
ncbi:MAG: hypothetical protein IEMM0002_1409 [bacterium]|nr:MAG: hypothetical protein IEMM0002_1409 [bacterium]